MCRHYRWEHDFWRRMGRREFYAWVDQAHREQEGAMPQPDRWNDQGADADWWEKARQKRRKLQGRA